MVTEELINYLKIAIENGKDEASTTQALLGVGWSKDDIDEAYKKAKGTDISEDKGQETVGGASKEVSSEDKVQIKREFSPKENISHSDPRINEVSEASEKNIEEITAGKDKAAGLSGNLVANISDSKLSSPEASVSDGSLVDLFRNESYGVGKRPEDLRPLSDDSEKAFGKGQNSYEAGKISHDEEIKHSEATVQPLNSVANARRREEVNKKSLKVNLGSFEVERHQKKESIKAFAAPQVSISKPISGAELIREEIKEQKPLRVMMSHGEDKTETKKRGIKNWILMTVVLLIIIAGGGTAAYFSFMRTPEFVISEAVSNLINAKSFSFDNEFEMTYEIDDLYRDPYGGEIGMESEMPNLYGMLPSDFSGESSFKLSAKGNLDLSNPEKPKARANISSGTDIMGMNVSLDATFLKPNENIYIKISDLTFLFMILGIDFTEFQNKWVEIDFDSEIVKEVMENSNNDSDVLTSEQEEKIKEAVSEHVFLSFSEKAESELIDGKKMFHYKINFNNQEFIALIKKISSIMEEDITDADIKEMEEFLNDMFFYGELWIGKKDMMLYKAEFKISFSELDDKNYPKVISFTSNFRDYGEKFEYEVPENTVSIDELTESIYGGVLGEARMKARDAMRVADIKQLQLAAEFYFDKYGRYPFELIEVEDEGFIVQIPTDPNNNQDYIYVVSEDGKDYILKAVLEGESSALTDMRDIDEKTLGIDCIDPSLCYSP